MREFLFKAALIFIKIIVINRQNLTISIQVTTSKLWTAAVQMPVSPYPDKEHVTGSEAKGQVAGYQSHAPQRKEKPRTAEQREQRRKRSEHHSSTS